MAGGLRRKTNLEYKMVDLKEPSPRRKVSKSSAWDANTEQANMCQPLHNTALKDKPIKGTSTQSWQLPKGNYGRSFTYKQSKIQPLQRTPESATQIQIYFTLLYFTLLVLVPFHANLVLAFQFFSSSLVPIPFIKLSTRIGHGNLRKILMVISQKFNTSSTNCITSTFTYDFGHTCV